MLEIVSFAPFTVDLGNSDLTTTFADEIAFVFTFLTEYSGSLPTATDSLAIDFIS